MPKECSPVQYVGKKPSIFYPRKYVGNVERIIVGEKIPETRRTTWPPLASSFDNWPSGSIGFLDFSEEIFENSRILEVRLIGIKPSFRGRGFATKLIQEVEKIARERNITRLITSGISIENKAMLLLIEKLGYSEVFYEEGQLPWRKHLKKYPNWITNAVFEKNIIND